MLIYIKTSVEIQTKSTELHRFLKKIQYWHGYDISEEAAVYEWNMFFFFFYKMLLKLPVEKKTQRKE